MKKLRKFMGYMGLGAIALILTQSVMAGSQSDKRPNIIFIMSDDHASHAISAYGSKINKTPHIDRLAKEGMRFDNCFCTNSICSPSRAVILTGKYSHMNGVIDNRTKLDGSQQTLPTLLQQAGYNTAIVGKWHLKSQPTGFHYSNVLPGQGVYHNPVMIENGKKQKHAGYVTDLITDSALAWLKKQESSDKPFFLMLHHKAPHANWEPDKKHLTMYTDGDIPFPATFNDDYETRTAQIKNHRLHVGPKQWALHFKRFGSLPEGMTAQETRQWVYQTYMKNYLRCIASVDDNVGRVLDYLDQTGLNKNTIVVYTSDQGFFLGDHGLYDKRFMYEHSLRMPLLVRYPEGVKRGQHLESDGIEPGFRLNLSGLRKCADSRIHSRAKLQTHHFEGRPPSSGELPCTMNSLRVHTASGRTKESEPNAINLSIFYTVTQDGNSMT